MYVYIEIYVYLYILYIYIYIYIYTLNPLLNDVSYLFRLEACCKSYLLEITSQRIFLKKK